MNRINKFQTPSGRKVALWGLVVALALLLVVGAGVQGSGGAEGQGSPSAALRTGEGAAAQSPISNIQYPTSSRTVTYTYDDAGRLIQADYGGGAVLDYAYDAAGNLLGRGRYNVYVPLVLR